MSNPFQVRFSSYWKVFPNFLINNEAQGVTSLCELKFWMSNRLTLGAYLEPSRTSMKKKLKKSLTVFAKRSIVDVRSGYEYVSGPYSA